MTGLVVGVEQETSIGVLGCVTVRGIVVGGGFFYGAWVFSRVSKIALGHVV